MEATARAVKQLVYWEYEGSHNLIIPPDDVHVAALGSVYDIISSPRNDVPLNSIWAKWHKTRFEIGIAPDIHGNPSRVHIQKSQRELRPDEIELCQKLIPQFQAQQAAIDAAYQALPE